MSQAKKRSLNILFPDVGPGWRKNFSQNSWLEPHFLPFDDIDALLFYLAKHKIQTIVPISLKSQRWLIKHQNILIKHGICFLTNNSIAINSLGDKELFYNFMQQNNLLSSIPVHYNATGVIHYPCVVKTKIGTAGKGIRIAHSVKELGKIDNNELITEYIDGCDEYATHMLFNHGKIINHVTFKYNFEENYYIAGRAERNIEISDCLPEHLKLFTKILQKLHYIGICCVDYKLINNTPIIFEFNARMGYYLTSNSKELEKMLLAYVKQSTHSLPTYLHSIQTKEIELLTQFINKLSPKKITKQELLELALYDVDTRTLFLEKIDYSFKNITESDLQALSIVYHIVGNINLIDNTYLKQLNGLNHIETISGSLEIINTTIEQINGLNNLRYIKSLTINKNNQLKVINGLTQLKNIKSDLHIKSNEQLSYINGLNSIVEITDNNLEIIKQPNLVEINGLNNIVSVGNSIVFNDCEKLKNINYLSFLTQCKNLFLSNLGISNADALKTFFSQNNQVVGYIKITHCNLKSIAFMEGLESVGSSFYLHYNKLINLTGLENLESVGSSFSLSHLKYCKK